MMQVNQGDRVFHLRSHKIAWAFWSSLDTEPLKVSLTVDGKHTIETWQAFQYMLVPESGDLVTLRYGVYSDMLRSELADLKSQGLADTQEYTSKRHYYDRFTQNGDRTLEGLLTVMRELDGDGMPQFRCKLQCGKITKVFPVKCLGLYQRAIDNTQVILQNCVN